MKSDKNCNNYYTTFDSDIEDAYSLCESNLTHEALLDMLFKGNIMQKQLAALKFDYINNKKDAYSLLNNLTGCDGKIREAAALKINQLMNESDKVQKIFADIAAKQFASATIDINANICRLVIDSAALLINYKYFATQYSDCITDFIYEAFSELDKFIFRDKKYVINKQMFKLYRCLDALNYFHDFIEKDKLAEILSKCSNLNEYTIREKTAQILIKTDGFEGLKQRLKNDENYYVREIFTSSRHP